MIKPPLYFPAMRRRAGGVSLVELMVALVIGLLLVFGAVTVYTQSRNTYRTNETAARLQEVARYALSVIETDVRLAGYWGLVNVPFDINNKARPTEAAATVDQAVSDNCGTNFTVDADHFVDGRNGEYDLECDIGDADFAAVDGADVLIVRRANTDAFTGVTPAADRIYVVTSRTDGDFYLGSDVPADLVPEKTEVRELFVHAYYVAERIGPDGLTQFSLRRQRLGAGPTFVDEEVIPGVQDLQVQFGVDTDGDAQADVYVNPDEVGNDDLVTSARIWLLIISETIEVGFENDAEFAYADVDHGSFNDNRRRLLVSKTIQIRNSRLPPATT